MLCRRRFSCAFKIAIIICCLIGILSNLFRTTSIQCILSFYTLQSNIFVLAFYILSFIIRHFRKDLESRKIYHFFKGATLVVILLTFVIYLVSLNPVDFVMDVKLSNSNIFRISNLFVHFITPVMVLLDYLIFDIKGYFNKFYPLIWYFFPLSYLAYVYTYSFHGGEFFAIGGSKKYAYFFLDIDKFGILGVLKYIILISLFFLFMCYFFVLLDNFLSEHKENNNQKKAAIF